MRSLSICLMVWTMLFSLSFPSFCFCPRAVEVAERAKRAIANVILIKNPSLNNVISKIMCLSCHAAQRSPAWRWTSNKLQISEGRQGAQQILFSLRPCQHSSFSHSLSEVFHLLYKRIHHN